MERGHPKNGKTNRLITRWTIKSSQLLTNHWKQGEHRNRGMTGRCPHTRKWKINVDRSRANVLILFRTGSEYLDTLEIALVGWCTHTSKVWWLAWASKTTMCSNHVCMWSNDTRKKGMRHTGTSQSVQKCHQIWHHTQGTKPPGVRHWWCYRDKEVAEQATERGGQFNASGASALALSEPCRPRQDGPAPWFWPTNLSRPGGH